MKNTPLFLYHGVKDKHIPVAAAKKTYQYFDHMYDADTKHLIQITYDEELDHGVNHKELAMLGDWLKARFNHLILPNLQVNEKLAFADKFNRVAI